VIPRIFHHIWVGPEPLPAEFQRYRKTWQRHHPDWKFHLWGEDNLPGDLRRPEVYETLRVPAERADILRLELLFRFGGVYVDADFECLRPFDPLIAGLDFFTAFLKPGRVNNAIIGSVPNHPIIDEALTELRPATTYGYDKAAAGPHFFDELMKGHPEATVFAPELFYPNGPAERRNAVAVHHAARSWKPDSEFRDAALLAEERLERTRVELDRANAEIRHLKAQVAVASGSASRAERARLLLRRPERIFYDLRILGVRAGHRSRRLRESARHVPMLLRRKLGRLL
jgi:inositol phosphorylceramide mannosyltransferase catalytic subunit